MVKYIQVLKQENGTTQMSETLVNDIEVWIDNQIVKVSGDCAIDLDLRNRIISFEPHKIQSVYFPILHYKKDYDTKSDIDVWVGNLIFRIRTNESINKHQRLPMLSDFVIEVYDKVNF